MPNMMYRHITVRDMFIWAVVDEHSVESKKGKEFEFELIGIFFTFYRLQ